MSTLAATVLGLNEHLEYIQTCPPHSLDGLVSNLGLHERLPVSYLDTLDEDDKATCYRAALICYSVTGSAHVTYGTFRPLLTVVVTLVSGITSQTD